MAMFTTIPPLEWTFILRLSISLKMTANQISSSKFTLMVTLEHHLLVNLLRYRSFSRKPLQFRIQLLISTLHWPLLVDKNPWTSEQFSRIICYTQPLTAGTFTTRAPELTIHAKPIPIGMSWKPCSQSAPRAFSRQRIGLWKRQKDARDYRL